MKKEPIEKRFEVIHDEFIVGFSGVQVLRDKQTGVLYLHVWGGDSSGGLTPLLDAEGKPIVEKGSE